MTNYKREFTGVWIPRHILEDVDLSATERILYAEIASFDLCYMSNSALSARVGVSPSTVTRVIAKLIDKGYIVVVHFDGRKRSLKAIYDAPNLKNRACLVKMTRQTSQNDEALYRDNNIDNNIVDHRSTRSTDRDEEVDFILDEFKKRFGAYPIDRKPRQVAHNIRQIASTFVKKYGEGYKKLRGIDLDTRSTITRAYDIYQKKESSQNVEYLDTFKRHMKKIFELTIEQMIKDGIIQPITIS